MKWLIIGALALLLFGCIGGQQKAGQPASGIGDADISPQDGEDEDLIASDDLIPPPDGDAGSSQVSVGDSITASDVEVVKDADDDLISEEDVIEPY